MNRRLLISACIKLACGLGCVCILVFLPAGSFVYPGAWQLLAILFVPMLIAGLIMWAKNPELLKKRLNAREKENAQKLIILLSLLMFIGGFVAAGLDFRFGWSRLPRWISAAASVLFLISYALYGEVLRENAYLSRTIEVQSGQKVVDTGLYGIVRHPMYAASVLMFLSMPLILGSIWSLIIFLIYPALIVCRIKNEEMVLKKELEGYAAYTKKVRYRLLPFIW